MRNTLLLFFLLPAFCAAQPTPTGQKLATWESEGKRYVAWYTATVYLTTADNECAMIVDVADPVTIHDLSTNTMRHYRMADLPGNRLNEVATHVLGAAGISEHDVYSDCKQPIKSAITYMKR